MRIVLKPQDFKVKYLVLNMKYIPVNTGLGAPNENYWMATNFRDKLNSYIEGKYCGIRKVMGYYTLVRPYPDKIDLAISELRIPKLLT